MPVHRARSLWSHHERSHVIHRRGQDLPRQTVAVGSLKMETARGQDAIWRDRQTQMFAIRETVFHIRDLVTRVLQRVCQTRSDRTGSKANHIHIKHRRIKISTRRGRGIEVKIIITLIVCTFAVAFTLPHLPSGDSKFILTLALGVLVGMTIRVISSQPTTKRKAVA